MTALEYMEQQVEKHKLTYDQQVAEGALPQEIMDSAMKLRFYEAAVEALQKVWKQNG